MKAIYTKNNYWNIILKMKRFDKKMAHPSFLNYIFKRISLNYYLSRSCGPMKFSVSPEQKLKTF